MLYSGAGITNPNGTSLLALNQLGSGIVNFGSGNNEASLAVTGLTNILSTSIPTAWIPAVPTADHTLSDHTYASQFITLACDTPVAGSGFNIWAVCLDKMVGTFTVYWQWS